MDSTCTLPQQLVYDIGQFIGVILENEKLSPSAEKRRSELHERLQNFTVPEIDISEDEEYEDPMPIRACSQLSNHSISGQSDDGAHLNITLNELKSMSTKYGPLWRKEKGIFKEVWRKHLAGIYEQKMVLFYSDKDLKPTTCINIQGYVARVAPNIQRDAKKKDITFELICPGKKNYQFFARTVKDMEQWIAIICQTSIQHINLTLSHGVSDHRLVIADDGTESRDNPTSRIVPHGEEIETEEFYDDIADSKPSGMQQINPVQDQPSAMSKKDDEETKEEELYNDVEEHVIPSPKTVDESTTWFVERKFDVKDHCPPIPPRKEPDEEEEEEIYHDIVEYERKLPVKLVMMLENNKPPPLPARRPLPPIPRDESLEHEEEEEETYEAIKSPIHMKQPEQNLQISENIKKEEYEEDVEETYDDVCNPNSSTEKQCLDTLPGSENNVVENEEVEEIYDDIGDTEHSSQTPMIKENINNINSAKKSHYNISELKIRGSTSGLNEKQLLNVTTEQLDESNQSTTDNKETNGTQNEGQGELFLQRKFSGLNVNIKSATNTSKQITNTKETNMPQNQIKNVKNMGDKFNQPMTPANTSFLYRHSSQEEKGNVQSILKKLQSKNIGSEEKLNNSSNQFSKSTGNIMSTGCPTDDKTSDFQNTFKKIEISLATGGKAIAGHLMKPNLPICPNKSFCTVSPTSPLKNAQNKSLSPKPTKSSSSESLEFYFNTSRNKSPVSRASSSSESDKRSSTNSKTECSLELPVNKPNMMPDSPTHTSIIFRQQPPLPSRNKPNLPDKPEKPPNKPSLNIKVTRNSSQTSKVSLNMTKNRPHGLPVPIPNIPNHNTSPPPKLPPRSPFK